MPTENYGLPTIGPSNTADIPRDMNALAEAVDDELFGKVDKVPGKGLSTNDYTTAEKTRVASIGDKAALTTTDKTDLVAAINEVKSSANDIKSKWSSVVGSPLVSSDTSDTLQSKTQTIKNTLATNLMNKGQSASGAETLTSLINKVAGISTGKKFATGTGYAEGPAQTFVLLTAINQTGTISRRYAQASGLGFTPSFILVVGEDISGAVPEKRHMTIFNANINAFAATNGDIVSVNTVAQAGQSPVVTTTVYALGEAGYVNSTGFRLPLDVRTANPITWFAFE